MSKNQTKTKSPAPRRWLWGLRALVAFALMALLLVGLYRCGYRSYKEVAVWATPGSHEALIYEEETFLLGGQLGKGNLTKGKFPVDEIIGRVADEAETTAETTWRWPPCWASSCLMPPPSPSSALQTAPPPSSWLRSLAASTWVPSWWRPTPTWRWCP